MKPVVFVGGVPGAGKTSLCSAVTASVPGSVAVTAGQLIQHGRGRRAPGRKDTDYVRPPVLDERDADVNQAVLAEQFSEVVAGAPGPVLLDGHFVIPTAAGIVPVAVDVFVRLKIEVLVLVDVEAATAAARLRARGGAAWWDGSFAAIEALVDMEQRHAVVVSGALGRAVHTLKPEEADRLAVLMYGG